MNNLLTIFKLIPAIIEIVKSAEAAFPEGGAGAKKLAFVLALLQTIGSNVDENLLTRIINVIVGHLFPHNA